MINVNSHCSGHCKQVQSTVRQRSLNSSIFYEAMRLRKVIKKTHHIMKDLKLHLHPTKTYIGKISHGFNFLGYYMDDKTLLPSSETIRRMSERATALVRAWCTKAVQ